MAEGFEKFPDPKDPRKALRVDGVKIKQFSNFRVPGQCTVVAGATVCPPAPPPQLVTVKFNRPTTEFGFTFRANRPDLTQPFIFGFNVTVNGQDLGFVPVQPDGVQYIGIQAEEGLQSAAFQPVDYFPLSMAVTTASSVRSMETSFIIADLWDCAAEKRYGLVFTRPRIVRR